MAEQARRRTGIVWAVVGAIVAVFAIGALLIGSLAGAPGADPTAVPTEPGSTASSSPSPTSGVGDVVDPGVADRGWVPEPITGTPDVYARAALEAAGTFDTTSASRDSWVSWLQTWFTPSPLYEDPQDAADQMARFQAELDQSVVIPQEVWDDLASEQGRVIAQITGEIVYLELPETTAAKMWTATADVTLTYTRSTPAGEVSYDETVRVSVQVVCDGESVPTPASEQRAGDCKVVRYFDEPVG